MDHKTADWLFEHAMLRPAARIRDLGGSPIEIKLGQALHFELYRYFLVERPELRWVLDRISIIPQFILNGHRFDFAIQHDFNELGQPLNIVIECDGHDFHERTPEQALRDRKRDRQAQHAGFAILRFTGREIIRDPIACAREILDFVFLRRPRD